MFSEVVNHVRQQRAFGESVFQPKRIHKLQKIRRIIGNVLDMICHDNYQEAETLIPTLPSQSLKRQTKTIIQKILMLNRRVANTRTSKEENQRLVKMWEEEANRLKNQLQEINRQTILRNQTYFQNIRRYKFIVGENEDLMRINAEMHRQYHTLNDQKDKLKDENEKMVDQCRFKLEKIAELEEQVSRMQRQNHELKHRLYLDVSRQQERLESSIIPSSSSRSLLRREYQSRQVNQQIKRNDPHVNEFVLGPGERWQQESDSSMVSISIKESIPSEAEDIQYCCFVRIEKKGKSGVSDNSKSNVERDERVRKNSDA